MIDKRIFDDFKSIFSIMFQTLEKRFEKDGLDSVYSSPYLLFLKNVAKSHSLGQCTTGFKLGMAAGVWSTRAG